MPLARTRLLPAARSALSFNGVDNYVSGPIVFPWGGIGYSATFMALAKILPAVIPSNYTWGHGHAGIITLGSNLDGGWLGVQYIGPAGAPATEYRLTSFYYIRMLVAPVVYDFNILLHIAFVYTVLSADSVEVKMYVNGSLILTHVHTVSGIGAATNVSSTYNLGRNNAWRGMYLKGAISGALIYSRALTDEEITWNYYYPDNPVRNGLVLWLHWDSIDTANNRWYDKSDFGNHATLYNNPVKEDMLLPPKRTLSPTRTLTPTR